MKEDKVLSQRLCTLLGYKSCVKIGNPCRGKWRGTTDYFLVFDECHKLFIDNGMNQFNSQVSFYIDRIIQFEKNKKLMLSQLQRFVVRDNETAKNEGLLEVKILDIDIHKQSEYHLLWCYVLMEVDGVQFRFVETSLTEAMYRNKLHEYFDRKEKVSNGTGVQEPTFVFSNTRYSHKDQLYKINC